MKTRLLTKTTLVLLINSLLFVSCNSLNPSNNDPNSTQNSEELPPGNNQENSTGKQATKPNADKPDEVETPDTAKPDIIQNQAPIVKPLDNKPIQPQLPSAEEKAAIKAKVFKAGKWSEDAKDYKEVIDRIPIMKTNEDFVSQVLLSKAKDYHRVKNMLEYCINNHNTLWQDQRPPKTINDLLDIETFGKFCLPQNVNNGYKDEPSKFFIDGKRFATNGTIDFAEHFNKQKKFAYKAGFFGLNTRTANRLQNEGFMQLLLQEYYLFAFTESLKDFDLIKEFKTYLVDGMYEYIELEL